MTQEGSELHRKICKIVMEHEQYFFGDISDDTRQVLMQVFRRLRSKGEERE